MPRAQRRHWAVHTSEEEEEEATHLAVELVQAGDAANLTILAHLLETVVALCAAAMLASFSPPVHFEARAVLAAVARHALVHFVVQHSLPDELPKENTWDWKFVVAECNAVLIRR